MTVLKCQFAGIGEYSATKGIQGVNYYFFVRSGYSFLFLDIQNDALEPFLAQIYLFWPIGGFWDGLKSLRSLCVRTLVFWSKYGQGPNMYGIVGVTQGP